MPQTRLYSATIPGGPSEAEQEAAFPSLSFDAVIVEDVTPTRSSMRAWSALRRHLAAGDAIALYSLDLLPLSLSSLNKALFKLLQLGVTIHVATPPLVITPKDNDAVRRMIAAYDAHDRRLLGRKVAKAFGTSVRVGRPRRLLAEQLPEIRAMMDDPGLNTADICQRLKVTRSTLYRFLANHKA